MGPDLHIGRLLARVAIPTWFLVADQLDANAWLALALYVPLVWYLAAPRARVLARAFAEGFRGDTRPAVPTAAPPATAASS